MALHHGLPCDQALVSGEDRIMVSKDKLRFQGYRRENGRVGIRNHVVILPLDDLSNAACEAVANNIKGCLAIRSEEHTSELPSLMRISYAVFCLHKKTTIRTHVTGKSAG